MCDNDIDGATAESIWDCSITKMKFLNYLNGRNSQYSKLWIKK